MMHDKGWTRPDLSAAIINILNIVRKVAAAMRPLVASILQQRVMSRLRVDSVSV